jgi:hypothetical protein
VRIIEPVLIKYVGISHDNDFKSADIVVHKIDTGQAVAIREAPLLNPLCFATRNGDIRKMLDIGIIRRSHSLWSAPVVNTLCKGHDESRFRTARPLLKYSICNYILIVPSSLSRYFSSFMAPLKLTNHEFLLSLRPRKHKLSQKWSSPCVKILSAFLYIVHAVYALIHHEVCQQHIRTTNSVTTDIEVFIYPNTF